MGKMERKGWEIYTGEEVQRRGTKESSHRNAMGQGVRFP